MPEWEGGIAPSPDSPESSFVAGATAACRGGMKIPSSLEWGLLVAATVLNGILAGGSLIKSGIPEETVLGQVYRGFTQWQTVRAILQVATFLAVVLALASLLPAGQ